MSAAASTVTPAARGSTTPESTPPKKALPFPAPAVRRGRATMAPSGTFWMAMASASVNAAAGAAAPAATHPA